MKTLEIKLTLQIDEDLDFSEVCNILEKHLEKNIIPIKFEEL